MSNKYILAIDQSTSGTKGLLFNEKGQIVGRSDLSHKQYVNEAGWVEHDPEEIYAHVIAVVKQVIQKAAIQVTDIVGVGISNQRETAVVWERTTSKPVYNAIVWQCARGKAICDELQEAGYNEWIKERTGLQLSPYFSASKISWVLKNVPGVKEKMQQKQLCAGTVDSWLIYKLTNGAVFKTDYSNASRTQLFNLSKLQWDDEVCRLFSIDPNMLPEVCDSNSGYGKTDFEGLLPSSISICSVMGDSQSALFGQGCVEKGMMKVTYGTGSSIMMNIGNTPVLSKKGLVTSIAWGMDGEIQYVLEGNVNYAGAVIKWMIDEVGLIKSTKECEDLVQQANQQDKTYLVPAFTGLGAPYWKSDATALITGMGRTTGKAELVKAGIECIAYQVTDIVNLMLQESRFQKNLLCADGGPTKNNYLMQFQSDLLDTQIKVSHIEELSATGVAYATGITLGIYDKKTIFDIPQKMLFKPHMEDTLRQCKLEGWKSAVYSVLR